MPDSGDAKAAWTERVLGVVVGGRGSGTLPDLSGWRAARATAIASLTALEAAVRGMDVPERGEAIILLRAIRANLTAEPATPQQVAELRRYIATDDIIAEAEDPNGFGIEVNLRAPLLAALDGLGAA